jgi:hypothetical protein
MGFLGYELKKGTVVEKSIYEIKPWLFTIFALYAVYSHQKTALLFVSSIILLFCSAMIIHARYTYRRHLKQVRFK